VSTPTIVVLVVALGTYAWKSAGPLVLGNRQLPKQLQTVIALMPAPLLAALVITATFADGTMWSFDARMVGLGAAIVALLAKRGFVPVVIVAALATALARAAGMP
jgi:branched-subunit amino acid transport protein AzlD